MFSEITEATDVHSFVGWRVNMLEFLSGKPVRPLSIDGNSNINISLRCLAMVFSPLCYVEVNVFSASVDLESCKLHFTICP